MKKFISLLKARPDVGAEDFTGWFVRDYAPEVLAASADMSRCVAYVPSGMRPKPGTETPRNLPYDVMVETWLGSDAKPDFPPFRFSPAFDVRVQESHHYRVEEWVVKDELDPARHGISPGVVLWTLLKKVQGLSTAEFLRHWSEHAPLAVRVHVGAAAYCQNRVEAVLTAGAPEFDGFGVLNFRTQEDLRDRLFTNEDDVQAVLEDSAEFVGTSLTMMCTEFVILDRAES